MIDGGLTATARLWPAVVVAFGWVHRAAHILGQKDQSAASIRRQMSGLLGALVRHRKSAGRLSGGIDHFVKVSRSYWSGLFACYDIASLPRTNNDLEQAFGSHRYHERRATGRKGASPALVLRGAAKLVAGLGTRAGAGSVSELACADRVRWRALRASLEQRRRRRVERRQFRRDPDAYLKALENKLDQSGLLS